VTSLFVASDDQAWLDIFDVRLRVVVPGTATDGAFSLFEEITGPGLGPPLHVHRAEDEFFRILEGRYRFRVGERDVDAAAGDTIVVPRGHPHAFLNTGRDPGRLMMGFSPGGAEAFFEQVAEEGLVVPEGMPRIAELGERYALEFLGPNPLAGA
jgi:mannose-6-phosphate isomerase-like protein (cupin superfamily)